MAKQLTSTRVLKSYEDFLDGVEPFIIGLNDCRAELDRLRWLTARQDQPDERILSADFKVDRVFGDAFDLSAAFVITVRMIDEATKKPEKQSVLTIACSFFGHFHASARIDRAYVRRFAESEARIVFTPYFRQFVTDLTARMSIPPIMIPLAIGSPVGGEERSLVVGKKPRKPHPRK